MNEEEKSRRATSIRQRLLNLSKQRNEDFNLVLTRYALERFLYRLSLSDHKEKWILKGAMLFQIWSNTPHRATRDMDFLSKGDNDPETIAKIITEICSIEIDEEDGLEFNLTELKVSEIRENAQ